MRNLNSNGDIEHICRAPLGTAKGGRGSPQPAKGDERY